MPRVPQHVGSIALAAAVALLHAGCLPGGEDDASAQSRGVGSAGLLPGFPDLIVVSVDASGVVTDGQTLATTGQLGVQLQNAGDVAVPGGFDVAAFDDRDADGAYDPAVDALLGTTRVEVGPEAFETVDVSIPIAGSLEFAGDVISVLADAAGEVAEGDETNNTGSTGKASQFEPPPGDFEPQLEWSWTASAIQPDALNVMSVPSVIDLTDDGIPDLVFGATASTRGGAVEPGYLRALNGDDGSEIFTVTSHLITSTASVATGDIDLDGRPEILAVSEDGRRILAFDHDGTYLWGSPNLAPINWGAPAIADLDGDGVPEVIVGNQVLDSQGNLLWSGVLGRGQNFVGPVSVVADVNLDGSPEVIGGNTLYAHDGGVLWSAPVGDGVTAVGNFDDDPFAEIVVVSGSNVGARVWLLEHTGAIAWGPVSPPGGGDGGPPTVADFDGDGEPEIGIALHGAYVVLETDGTVLWQAPIWDSSNKTGSSVFDFEGDGLPEVVYGDERNLWVFRGTDGGVLFKADLSSCTWQEYPLVADVDADGNAEIVAVANNSCGVGVQRGVFVYGDARDNWVATRRIWNQHSYHVTNVNPDGTIPAVEENNWQVEGLNNYRLNELLPGEGGANDAPDLIPSLLRSDPALCDDGVSITARIGNGGSLLAPAGVSVAFYDGDPSLGGALLGVVPTAGSIDPSGYEDVTLVWNGPPLEPREITVSADDDGAGAGSVNEGFEDNNSYAAQLPLCANRPPEADDQQLQTPAGVALPVVLTATDPDGDPVSFAIVDPPARGQFVGDPPDLLYVPEAGFAGDDAFTFVANDGLEDSNVANVAIAVLPPPPLPAVEGIACRPKETKVDVTWSAVEGAILYRVYRYSGAARELAGESASTLYADFGLVNAETYTYTVVPVDAFGTEGAASAPCAATPNVRSSDGNRPPEITSAPVLVAHAGQAYAYDVEAFDPEGEALVYALAAAPAGMTIDPATGLVQWTPGAAAVGSQIVTVRAADPAGLADAQGYLVEVILPPPLEAGPDREITEGDQVLVVAEFADPTASGPHTATIDWGDGSSEPAVVSEAGGVGTVSGAHVYPEDGVYAVEVCVTNAETVCDGFTVTVANALPVVTLDPLPAAVEGDSPDVGASFGDAGVLDTHTATIDWGDGFVEDLAVNGGGGAGSVSAQHLYPQNGTFAVAVCVTDDEGDTGCASADLVVENAAPEQRTCPDSQVVQVPAYVRSTTPNSEEGRAQAMTFTGVYLEPGDIVEFSVTGTATGGHNASPQDADGGPPGSYPSSGTVSYYCGSNQLCIDEFPNVVGPQPWIYSVIGTIFDPDATLSGDGDRWFAVGTNRTVIAEDEGELVLLFHDALYRDSWVPVYADNSGTFTATITVSCGFSTSLTEGSSAEIRVGFTDRGVLDTHTATIDWGDGIEEPGGVDQGAGSGAVIGSHAYLDDGDFDVDLCVLDSDGAETCEVRALGVLNLPPIVAAGPDVQIDVGDTVVLVPATFTDPGALDTHTAIIGWGDATEDDGVVSEANGSGSVAGGHTYDEADVFTAQVCVFDDANAVGCDDFEVRVNGPPAITSMPVMSALPFGGYAYDVEADDPNPDDELTFFLDAAPAGMSIDPATGLISWTPTAEGDVPVSVRVSDLRGLEDTQDFVISVVADTNPPQLQISVEPTRVDPGETVTIVVTGSDDAAPPGFELTVDGEPVALDPDGQTEFTPTAPGVVEIVVVATDASGNQTTETVRLPVRDPSDTTPPVAVLEAPDDLAEITFLEDLIGTASDANLFRYRLFLAPADGDAFTIFAEGTQSVVSDVLATFDATLLENGLYRIVLEAEDVNGETASDQRVYEVSGLAKVGALRLSFLDLMVPVAGIPISVVRSYDSLVKESRDFGVGWTLDLRRASLVHNRRPGDGWSLGLVGINCALLDELGAHVTRVQLSPRESYLFALRVVPGARTIGACFASVSYEQIDGTFPGASLEVLDGTDLIQLDGGTQLLYDELEEQIVFDPKRLRLTTVDGRAFELDLDRDGVVRVREPNGVTLDFEPTGVVARYGTAVLQSIEIQRDAEGRISRIFDPAGEEYVYEYDARGDLVLFREPTESPTETGPETRFEYDDGHNLVRIIDPSGRAIVASEYDGDGRLIASTDPRGSTSFDHDLAARESVVFDPLGHPTRYVYDELGQILRQETTVTSDGAVVPVVWTFEYDGDGNQTSRTDPDGVVLERTFDAFGNVLTATTDPGGLAATETANYGPRGELLSREDATGVTRSFEYDAFGNVEAWEAGAGSRTLIERNALGLPSRIESELGGATEYGYDARGYVVSESVLDELGDEVGRRSFVVDAAGRTTSETVEPVGGGAPITTHTEYDALGRETRSIDAFSHDRITSYDERGLVGSFRDELERETRFEYDEAGALVRKVYPGEVEETFSYDARGLLTSSTDVEDRTTLYEYDELGRRIRVVSPGSGERRIVYTPGGRVAAAIDSLGQRTDFEYDSAGRRVRVVLPAVEDPDTGLPARPEIGFEYDAAGRVTAVVDPLGNRFETEFDDRGLPVALGPPGAQEERAYDGFVRLLSQTTPDGMTTDFEYDALGRLSAVVQPAPEPAADRPTTRFDYDDRSNLLARTDALGRPTGFGYDAADRLVEEIRPDLTSASYGYDEVGNLTLRTDFASQVTEFGYDERNRRVEALFDDGSERSFTYLDDGLPSSATDERGTTLWGYDEAGRLAEAVDPETGGVAYDYDTEGRVVRVATAQTQIDYEYDALGRMVAIDADGDRTEIRYDLAGGLRSVLHPNGVLSEFVLDGEGNVTRVAHTASGGALIASYDYVRRPGGRVDSVTESDGTVTLFDYDGLGRLAREMRVGSDGYEIAYEYDAVGNRTTRIEGSETIVYSYDDRDLLLSGGSRTFSYDDNGNLTGISDASGATDYAWDAQNRLVGVDGPAGEASYEYDAEGRRVAKTTPLARELYVFDARSPTGFDQVIETQDESGAATRSYWYGPGARGQHEAGSSSVLLRDGGGNVRAVSDDSGAVTGTFLYDAYGGIRVPAGGSGDGPRYAGEWYDEELGAYYLRARYYDPATGRFLSEDPFAGAFQDPRTLHRYLYAFADPVNFADPSGAEGFSLAGQSTVLAGIGILATISVGITVTQVLGTVSPSAPVLPDVDPLAGTRAVAQHIGLACKALNVFELMALRTLLTDLQFLDGSSLLLGKQGGGKVTADEGGLTATVENNGRASSATFSPEGGIGVYQELINFQNPMPDHFLRDGILKSFVLSVSPPGSAAAELKVGMKVSVGLVGGTGGSVDVTVKDGTLSSKFMGVLSETVWEHKTCGFFTVAKIVFGNETTATASASFDGSSVSLGTGFFVKGELGGIPIAKKELIGVSGDQVRVLGQPVSR